MPLRSIYRVLPLAVLLAASPLGAQAPTPPSATVRAPAGSAAVTGASDAQVDEAVRLIEAGDTVGALRHLEARRAAGDLGPAAAALLGVLLLEGGAVEPAWEVLAPLAQRDDATAPVLYNAGRAAMRLGRNGDAARLLARSYEREPASPAARELGLLFARQGKAVEAYRFLRPWALRAGNDVEARVTAASLAVKLDRPWEVEELLAGLPPGDPAVRLLRGQAYVLERDAPLALAELVPLWNEHPPGMELEVRRALAEARLLAGQPGEARNILNGHVQGHPSLAALLARAHRLTGDAAAAQATLEPLVASLPSDPAAVADARVPAVVAEEYGRALVALGFRSAGVEYLQRATVLHPQRLEAWVALAEAYEAGGQKAEAATARQRAEELRSAAATRRREEVAAHAGQADGMTLLVRDALALVREGRPAEALERLRSASADTADPGARIVEVQALLMLRHFQEAHDVAVAAVQTDPQQPDLVYQHGATLVALERLPEAERQLRRTLELAPDHVPAMNDLAVVLLMLERPAEARPLLERVLQLRPDDALARQTLAEANRQLAGPG